MIKPGPGGCINKKWNSRKFQLCISNSSEKWPMENWETNCHFLSLGSCSDTQNFTNKIQERTISAFQWSSPHIFFKKVVLTFWNWWIFSKMSSKCTNVFVNWCKFDSWTHIQRVLIAKRMLRTLQKLVFCKWSKNYLT